MGSSLEAEVTAIRIEVEETSKKAKNCQGAPGPFERWDVNPWTAKRITLAQTKFIMQQKIDGKLSNVP